MDGSILVRSGSMSGQGLINVWSGVDQCLVRGGSISGLGWITIWSWMYRRLVMDGWMSGQGWINVWSWMDHYLLLRQEDDIQIYWLIDYLRFYVPLKNFSLIWRRHQCRWRAAKFRPMLSAQGLWAGRDLYRATSAVKRDLGFSGLIRRTATISRLLRHTCGIQKVESQVFRIWP
jgi:hypothetical protein